ncbi:MAG: hypothetical protein OWV35_02980, partial [Firmicutes bacterium]|nr:hypothetical protein [Bacillota bacterium]
MGRIYRVEFRRVAWWLELEAGRLWLLGPGFARRRLLEEGVTAAYPVAGPLAVGTWMATADGRLRWLADVGVPGAAEDRGPGRLLGGRGRTVVLSRGGEWVVWRPEGVVYRGPAPVPVAAVGTGWVEGPGRRLYALVADAAAGCWWVVGWDAAAGFFRQPEAVEPPGTAAALHGGPDSLHLLWCTPEAVYVER